MATRITVMRKILDIKQKKVELPKEEKKKPQTSKERKGETVPS